MASKPPRIRSMAHIALVIGPVDVLGSFATVGADVNP